jgi:cysteine-rich repeat protein
METGPEATPVETLDDAHNPRADESTGTEGLHEAGPELAAEVDLPCEPGGGCFLDPCDSGDGCLSGWCVGHMGEDVCSQLCETECPAGWSCELVPGTVPDVVYICVSKHANLCLPCASGADCKGAAGIDDVCVNYQSEGSFCGGKCSGDDDCPWGFHCRETVTTEGVETVQCVADSGVCPCTTKSVVLSLTTPCTSGNEYGLCKGKRVCGPEGLSPCDALLPSPEVCNGSDDDCDEAVDEPAQVGGDYLNLCDDGSQCTKDVCAGQAGCQNEPLSGSECIDGNPCTVADHCQDGVCIGTPVDCNDGNPCTDDGCNETGGCVFVSNQADCDDGDPCTVADECSDGFCAGLQVACDCKADADCDLLEDGDACNGTLICDLTGLPYQCGIDPATVVQCPEPEGLDALCLAPSCKPESGQCSLVPVNEGLPCTDANACTVGDQCAGGKCNPGVKANCADDNPCTDDSCDANAGCAHVANQTSCQDGDACTVGDVCSDGTCLPGQALGCNDGNPCTKDSCDPLLGCLHSAAPGPCEDGNPCTATDSCQAGVCVGQGAVACDDGNPCTSDLCVPELGCTHQVNKQPCDDGNICTIGDHCELGACIGASKLWCNDGNPCTQDACEPGVGCSFKPADGVSCEDSNACTGQGQCKGGACLPGEAVDCEDGNPCTTDGCKPASGCVHAYNSVGCDDGDLCTTGDHCQKGVCLGGKALECDDGDPCTDDFCDGLSGCGHSFNDAPCNDDDACTGNDACTGGTCLGVPLNCGDGNVCTDDSCDPAKGCAHKENTAPCDDGNPCTSGDKCGSGSCLAGGPTDCDDKDACTNDSCLSPLGCLHTPLAPCCGNGKLEAGEECDDGNVSSGDGCSAACKSEGVLFKGYATWIQDCYSQSDAAMDTAMDQACKNKYGVPSRAATNPEMVEKQILNLPPSNTSGNHLICKCPGCAGKTPWGGAVSGHARACLNSGDPWPSAIYPDGVWNPSCCNSDRTTICVGP